MPANVSPPKSNSWRIWTWAAGIIVVAVTGWLFLKKNLVGPAPASPKVDKSIAVLPFRNESADKEETQYFCNGVMESVLNDLSQIGELRVISRQSIERFRGSTLPILSIAKELGVAYLLEGSVQRADERMKINAQLIHTATDRHVWADEFVGEMDDIFALQSEIAKSVVRAMKATIAPDEIMRLERTPTDNLDAWDLYLQAQASYGDLALTSPYIQNESAYSKTVSLCDQALALDPSLAEAWTLKARVWWHRNYWRELLKSNFMDSVALFAKKALALDSSSAMALTVLGNYYNETGQSKQALLLLEKAVRLDPNQIESLVYLAVIQLKNGDYERAYASLIKAFHLTPNSFWTPFLYRSLGTFYFSAADIEKAEFYFLKARSTNTSPEMDLQLIGNLYWVKIVQGKFDDAAQVIEGLKKTGAEGWLFFASERYGYTREFAKSDSLFARLYKVAPSMILPAGKHRWAYALWNTGKKKEAKELFKQAEDNFLKIIHEGRDNWAYAKYDLAGIYTFLGQKEKAWQQLQEFDKYSGWPWGSPYFIQVDPLFDNLRNDPEYKQMLQRVFAEKAKLQQQIRQWEVEGK